MEEPVNPFARNLKMFNTQPRAARVRRLPEQSDRAELLHKLVNSEVWLALHEEAEDFVASYERPLPSSLNDLIGHSIYGIVRDVKDKLFRAIEERAAKAGREEQGQ